MLVGAKDAGRFGQGRRKVQGAVNFDDIGIDRNLLSRAQRIARRKAGHILIKE